MYSNKLLEEFYNPENVGVIKGADTVGKVKDRTCGDIIKIYMTIKNNNITDVAFQAYGNPVSIAAASKATKLIKGKSIDEAYAVSVDTLSSELGAVSANRKYSLSLVEEAIKEAIVSYFKKKNGKVPEKYLTGSITNSDAIEAEEETEEEAKPVKEEKAKKAEKVKEEKLAKKTAIVEDDLDEDDLDDEDLEEDNEEEAEVEEKPASNVVSTKTTQKSIEVFTRNGDSEEDDLYGSIDNLTSTIGEALKKLNEEDKK